MDFVNKRLLEVHKRWIDAYSEVSALLNDGVICIADVLNAHLSLADYFFENGEGEKDVEDIGLIDKGLLSSAVAMQIDGRSENLKWETDYEKCSALFYGLIKNHPFHHGNKRTALLTALYYLSKLNRRPTAHHKELEIITRIIASNTIKDRKAFKPFSKFENGEIRFLAQYFQKYTRPIFKKCYVITYNELNKKLGDFGFSLNDPHGNSIDIIRIEKRASLFGFRNKREKHTKIGVIGFPGWTREVPRKEMKILRGYTGLTAKDGFDSQCVYKKAPPLSSLINEYSGVFHRLAQK